MNLYAYTTDRHAVRYVVNGRKWGEVERPVEGTARSPSRPTPRPLKKGLKKGGTYEVSAKATCAGHEKTVTATIRVK